MKFRIFNTDPDEDDDVPVLQCRKVLFKDLIELPKRERSKQLRKKVFHKHLLSSPQNQEIIRNADKVSKRKEELEKAKSEAYKRFLEGEKQKKKELTRKKTGLLLGLIKCKPEVCQHQLREGVELWVSVGGDVALQTQNYK